MHIYLVGGAVRDTLLNIKVSDQDWVVVGSSPQELIRAGYLPVGKDFPVFIHPKTKQEYALARTERKVSAGHTGFECFFSPSVTLEEDLSRRDLTINAMAQHPNGQIVDPFKGQRDLKDRQLRHVSDAFIEDPLRILRVARFHAKLFHLGFKVAPETLLLMKDMVKANDLQTLTPERIWQEWNKSLATPNPQIFLSTLRDCGALAVILPELDALFGVPQPEQWHPEIDTGIHTLLVAKQAALLSESLIVRFSAQVHDLGKGITPKEEWPSHKRHCQTGIKLIKELCNRICIPNEFKELALMVCEHHSNIHRASELKASTKLRILNKCDVWRKPHRLEDILLTCMADSLGRTNFEHHPYPQKHIFEQAYQAALNVNAQDVIRDGFQGASIRTELEQRRIIAIKDSIAK